MPKIVVGVDGSETSRRALEWAAEEARLRAVTLEVVHVHQSPAAHDLALAHADASGEGATRIQPQYRADRERAEGLDAAHQQAQAVIEDALRQTRLPAEVEVERTALVNRRPVNALLAAAEDAELLVVGSRGLGGFRGLLLGSVSQQVTHHSRCPVVVVRGEDVRH